MGKSGSIYECSHCGAQTTKWAGRCFECGKWGTLAESTTSLFDDKPRMNAPAAQTTSFADIDSTEVERFSTGVGELDQVLGGGVVPGSLVLLGGEPGIGKSTLLLQIAIQIAQQGKNVLYCSGEESAQQVKMRLDRLSTDHKGYSDLLFVSETNIEKTCSSLIEQKPALAIIDSIQTIHSTEVNSEAGSVAQVRACTMKLLEVAKQHHIPIVVVGHVTKEGMVAGPKTLEHMVDTVLYLEGDAQYYYRLLKTVKNRFGSTNEMGVFEMTNDGLTEVTNPSQAFIQEDGGGQPGTVTTVVMEGSRAFLVQVQALTSKTYFGYPQRRAVGFDGNRLQLLIAVLSKRVGLNLGDQDVHLNVVGGFKVQEPAIDLAVCTAILSAYKSKAIDKGVVVFGEVGLNGEVRPVSQMEKRLKESEKLGFSHAFIPAVKKLTSSLQLHSLTSLKDIEL